MLVAMQRFAKRGSSESIGAEQVRVDRWPKESQHCVTHCGDSCAMCCTSSPIGGIFMACSQPGELLFGCSDVSSCYVACLAFVRGCVIASRNLSKPGRGLPSTKATLAAAPLGTRAKEVAKGRSAVGDTAGSGRCVDRRVLPLRRDRTPPGAPRSRCSRPFSKRSGPRYSTGLGSA